MGESVQSERWNRIRAELEDQGSVSVSDLARRFAVSEMTIRRDLSALAARGTVRKIHGGAVPIPPSDEPAAVRSVLNVGAKEAIAIAAALRVPDGGTVVLDSGTTVGALAKRLRGRRLTVITTSFIAFHELADDPETDIHLPGGRYRPETRSLTGPAAWEGLRELRVDMAFLGTSGIRDGSFFNHQLDDIPIQRRILEIANEVWLLADRSKLGAIALGRVARLDQLRGVIVDSSVDGASLDQLREWSREVVMAG